MQKLLILHGALGARSQFGRLSAALRNDFDVHSINFTGHGGEVIPAEAFSIAMFSNDILKWLDDNNINSINIFGYSTLKELTRCSRWLQNLNGMKKVHPGR